MLESKVINLLNDNKTVIILGNKSYSVATDLLRKLPKKDNNIIRIDDIEINLCDVKLIPLSYVLEKLADVSHYECARIIYDDLVMDSSKKQLTRSMKRKADIDAVRKIYTATIVQLNRDGGYAGIVTYKEGYDGES